MASLLSARIERAHQVAFSPPIPPEGLPHHKLDRLLELRAVIDALRYESKSQDPLLSWIIEHEHAERP